MRNHPQNSATQQNFLRKLSENVHELAQPLSILQASLELALLSPITAEQHQDVAESALREVRRAVECMQFIACLTRFQQPAADVREVSLRAALEGVISDLQRTLESAQVELLICASEHDSLIRISPVRLRQMLFYVLQAVQGCSRPGDLVHIEIQQQGGNVLLWIEQSLGRSDQAEGNAAFPVSDNAIKRALALAEAIVSNAGGLFRMTTNPLLVVAEFPPGGEGGTVIDQAVGTNPMSDTPSARLAVSSR